MRINSILRIAGCAGMLCGMLSMTALAQNNCSTGTFSGAYGFTVTGFVLPPNPTGSFGLPPSFGGENENAVPIQGIQLITSDGRGNLTDSESLNLAGSLLAVTSPQTSLFSSHYGTYTVNSNCTGVAFLTNAKYVCPTGETTCPSVSFITLAFIINTTGTTVRMVGTPTCNAPAQTGTSSCTYDTDNLNRTVTSVGERLDVLASIGL